ncbi:MAG: SpoIIE family protein phosphatase [Deltaproteobacteria bacterium]|nr:SpoIIE family protein phosphatase [Deltaproteobacteria bacterium]
MTIIPKSLQQRLSFFVLLPVTVLLLGMGLTGFLYARNKLLDQWSEAIMLRLQHAAHEVDMRLDMPKMWLDLFHQIADKSNTTDIQDAIIAQLKGIYGVTRVQLKRSENPGNQTGLAQHSDEAMPHRFQSPPHHAMRMAQGGHDHQGIAVEISPTRFDTNQADQTISLITEIKDNKQQIICTVEVEMRLEYLVETLKTYGWWQTYKAFLVDSKGRILAATTSGSQHELGETGDPVELETLDAIKEKPLGIVFGSRHHTYEVSGFYRLQEAPWVLVMIAPSSEVLAPINTFRTYYLISGLTFILFIVLLIRSVTGRTVAAIKDVSRAAEKLAGGDFGQDLPVKSRDEVGELTASFNAMAHQLEERMRLKESLYLAMEVQQNLLPQQSIKFCGLDIAGKSLYCDDTGGDYYDFLQFPEMGRNRIGIAVGDVTGHGISAALLMATVRALLRSRITQPGTLSRIVSDVNRQLSMDTSLSGNFMTLFVMVLDCNTTEIQWVRAGHDATLIYNPLSDSFRELTGSGMALGVDDSWDYQEYKDAFCAGKEIILIGTDGIWEAENPQGERFGKDRLRQVIRRNHQSASGEIIEAVLSAVSDFRQKTTQADDITLVVVKS